MRRKFMRSLAIKICPSRILLEIANHVSGVAVIVGKRLDATRLSHFKSACPSSLF